MRYALSVAAAVSSSGEWGVLLLEQSRHKADMVAQGDLYSAQNSILVNRNTRNKAQLTKK